MSYKVQTTPNFEREARKLSKKYQSLKRDLQQLINQLSQNPTEGTHLGSNVYKIRLAIASKGKGKSGGARVIAHFVLRSNKVYLLSIYNKGEQDTISAAQIQKLLEQMEEE